MLTRIAPLIFFSALVAYGCLANHSDAQTDETGIPDNGDTYLSCDQFTVRYLDDDTLGFFDLHGELLFMNDRPSVSFMSAPSTSSGQKKCGEPIGVTQHGMYGYIMPDGSLFANRLFENSYGLYKNTLAYSENGRWGLMRGDEKIIVSPVYNEIGWYGQGRFIATIGDVRLFMDHLGQTVPIEESEDYSEKYKTLLPPRRAFLSCPDNMTRASKGGLWGILDHSGNVVVPFKFRAVSCLYESGFWAPDEENRRWCQYDVDEQITESCSQDFYFSGPVHYFPEQFVEDAFENSVIWNRMYLDYGEGRQNAPPALVGDGVRGHGIVPAAPLVYDEMEPGWFK